MKEICIPSNRPNKGHYVPGMIAGGLLFVSGQLPVDHSTGEMSKGDFASQVELALHNMELVLKEAGVSRSHVAMCRIYISDISNWDTANRVYAEFFGTHKPARVIVPSRDLHYGALVEIEAVAEMQPASASEN